MTWGNSAYFNASQSNGEYIAYLGGDDVWFTHKLEEQVKPTHPQLMAARKGLSVT
jgi:hypothetical protein